VSTRSACASARSLPSGFDGAASTRRGRCTQADTAKRDEKRPLAGKPVLEGSLGVLRSFLQARVFQRQTPLGSLFPHVVPSRLPLPAHSANKNEAGEWVIGIRDCVTTTARHKRRARIRHASLASCTRDQQRGNLVKRRRASPRCFTHTPDQTIQRRGANHAPLAVQPEESGGIKKPPEEPNRPWRYHQRKAPEMAS